jgi:hypothetical protein
MNKEALLAALKEGAVIRERFGIGVCIVTYPDGTVAETQRSAINAAIRSAKFWIVKREHLLGRYKEYVHHKFDDPSLTKYIVRQKIAPLHFEADVEEAS